MSDKNSVRKFEPELKDYLAAALGHPTVDLTGEIEEGKVANFCNGCDNLQNGTCSVCGANDQARYAARGWCGWARVDGKRGEMTAEGFKSSS